jgi:hypothetical protein
MHCPRLEHFVRFNFDGTVSRCGHMINAPGFTSLDDMESSAWLIDIKQKFATDVWPSECVRCQEVEQQGLDSIRTHAINAKEDGDYLQVGGVLDNVCNAACMTCNENLSTRIGSLQGRVFPIVDNSSKFWSLPQDERLNLVNSKKNSLTEEVMKDYGYKYKIQKKSDSTKDLIDELKKLK